MNDRLLVAATLPPWPVRDGLSLRLAAMLEALSERWTIALVAPRLPESEAPVDLRWYQWGPARPDEPWGFFPWRFDTAPLCSALARASSEFVPSAGLAFFGSEHCWPLYGPPAVHDRVDCSTLTAWRYLRMRQSLRRRASRLLDVAEFARYEARVLRSFRTVTVVGDDDARWLRRLGRGCAVHVLRNGVATPPRRGSVTRSGEPLVVFSGNMAYEPNVDATVHFARNIWPRVRQAMPRARFLVAGRHPTAAVTLLGGHDGITVCGAVGDMAQTIAQAWVAVAPMRCGAGVKNKILEAWAAGLPVIMTHIARNGLALPPGTEHLVHDTDDAFSACLTALLLDEPRRNRLGVEAREHVQQHYTWRDVAGRMHTLLQEVGGARSEESPRLPRPAALKLSGAESSLASSVSTEDYGTRC